MKLLIFTTVIFGRREAPSQTALQKLVEKFELFGQIGDVKNKNTCTSLKKTDNISAVAQSFEETPNFSIPRRSLELSIPQTSLLRILHKDVGLRAYKVQLT